MEIDEAVRLAELERRCYNVECPDYRKYNQCENHSYVLCPQFEDFYTRRKQEREMKDNERD